MNLPQSKLPKIKIFRWDATEIYDENDVLIGYIEIQKGANGDPDTYREIYLNTYDVEIWGDESQRERRQRLGI